MQGLAEAYIENCKLASTTPNEEFLAELQERENSSTATLDFKLDGGITYQKLEDRDFSVIIDTLKKGGCIHSIKVPHNNLTDLILPGIAQLINQSDSITEIDLSSNQFTADGIKLLQEALSQSQSLTHISFAQNEIGDEGCLLVIQALRVNRTITHVDLSDTGMSHSALTILGSIIGQINRLKVLHIDNPHPKISPDDAAKRFLLSMRINDSIQELSFARARIGDDSAYHLSDALASNKTLTRLRIRGNAISCIGAERLAKALKGNKTLEVLDISGNRLGDKGAEAFAEMLIENTHLQRIDLSLNGIRGTGLLAICKALPANSAISDMNLWGNHFVDDSVMTEYSNLMESGRGQTLLLDFTVHFTNDDEHKPYLARTAVEDSPKIWE